jgi:hypothetical protein
MARTLIDWTEERLKILKRMWAEGSSGQQIADRLGVTRSGVLGKINRLGLERAEAANKRNRATALEAGRPARKRKPVWSPKGIKPAAPQQPLQPVIPQASAQKIHGMWTRADRAKGRETLRAKAAMRREEKPPRIPTVHVSTFTGAIIPGPSPLPPQPLPAPTAETGQPITIFEVTAHNCCWPINAGRPEWLFCGCERDPKSGSGERGYCTAHWRKSLQRRAA